MKHKIEARAQRPAHARPLLFEIISQHQAPPLNVTLSALEIAVAADKIVFVQGEVTGNIWMAQLRF